MSATLRRVQALTAAEQIDVPSDALRRMIERGLDLETVFAGVVDAEGVEDYQESRGLPQVLVLQRHGGRPLHVVWEITNGKKSYSTVVTAYFPDPRRW